MTVVQELDKTLFDGYIKPKADHVMGILRDGILDTNIDWYETPQPTGILCHSCPRVELKREPL
jgi:exocyst complex component 2